MSKRTGSSTKEYLKNALLPEQTDTYTVIPHTFVMEKTEEILAKKGFEIERTLYKCNLNAQVAQGVYHLRYGDDPEMSMLVAWSNSYDKSMRFKFAVGAYLHESLNSILSQKIGMWDRKHTGTADKETEDTIIDQLDKASEFYAELVRDKNIMKTISLTENKRAEILGSLFFDKEILTTEQMTIIKHELKQPSFIYDGEPDSLWTVYNHINYALQKAHPKQWMDQQRLVHWFLHQKFDLTPKVDPAQLDLVEQSETLEQILTECNPKKIESVVTVMEIVENQIEKELLVARDTVYGPGETVLEFEKRETGHEEIQKTAEQELYDAEPWHCLDCNKEQKPSSVFYDGQRCETCHVKNNTL